MVVNAKDERCASRAVDKPKEMLLARGKFEVEVTPRSCGWIVAEAVHDNAVCSSEVRLRLLIFVRNKSCRMNIILDENRAEIHVPVTTAGSVDDEWSQRSLKLCEFPHCKIGGMVMEAPTSEYCSA